MPIEGLANLLGKYPNMPPCFSLFLYDPNLSDKIPRSFPQEKFSNLHVEKTKDESAKCYNNIFIELNRTITPK